mgnify:FL=1
MKARKLFRKYVASLLKRYYIMTSNGYSVGKAYGARFLLDWRHSLDKKVAVELYEHDQITYLCRMIDILKPDMFIDIGSHAALYAIIAKSRLATLEVHAFEPDRTNLCQLYANLFINKMEKLINVHEHGLSNNSDFVKFDTAESTTSRGTRRISSTGDIEIQVRRLDDIIKCNEKIIVVKVDVEGHEKQVLDGARTLLARNQCLLQIESFTDDFDALKDLMATMDYRHIMTINDYYFSNISEIPDAQQ